MVPVLASVAVAAWASVVIVAVGGRIAFDRSRRLGERGGRGAEARLVARALDRPRTGWGRWRRIVAIHELARRRHPVCRLALVGALGDADADARNAAVRALGDLGDDWAVSRLVETLARGVVPRSRVATQIERLAPAAGPELVPLLAHYDPELRRWAATLLASCPGLATDGLVALLGDPSAEVRAAAVESLGRRHQHEASEAASPLLDDEAWFVRVHAARALSDMGRLDDVLKVVPLLADERWWVRNAAKDALRARGREIEQWLIPYLDHPDRFAREGAAEVLQDVGYLEALRADWADFDLLQRLSETLLSATGESG